MCVGRFSVSGVEMLKNRFHRVAEPSFIHDFEFVGVVLWADFDAAIVPLFHFALLFAFTGNFEALFAERDIELRGCARVSSCVGDGGSLRGFSFRR